jgi:hypothetical protein
MTTSIEETRRTLLVQGFDHLADHELEGVDFGSRVAPAIGAVWTAVAIAVGSAAWMGALVPLAVLGALLRNHPFDLIYNHGLRHFRGETRLPPYGAPRRFALGVAAVWLSITAIALSYGYTGLGTLFGVLMVATSVEAASTGFCVMANVWHLLFNTGTRSRRGAATPV